MTTNRVELLVAVEALSTLGAAAVLISPAWKAREVGHALEVTEARRAVTEAAFVDLLGQHLGREAVIDVDDPATAAAVDALRGDRVATPDLQEGDEAVLVFSSGTTGLPKAVRHTHGSIVWATAHWVAALGLGPDDRFQVATPPSHILGLLNLLAAVEAGATVRLHARFDLDEVLHGIERERMTLEMAVAPIALALANHPDLEDLRPVVAALHHVGRHPRDRERRPDRDRAHRRPLAPRLRRQRAAGHRRQPGRPTPRPGGSTPPASRRPTSSSGSSTSTTATPSPPGRSARSRPAARR